MLKAFAQLTQGSAFWTSHSTADVICKTAFSAVAFTSGFLLLRVVVPRKSVPPPLRVSWALKATSLLHSLVVAPAAFWALACEPEIGEATRGVLRFDSAAAAGPLNHAVSAMAGFIVPITLGYFVFDLLLVPYWEGSLKAWIPMILHHGLSLLTWPVGLVHPACHLFLLVCVSMEASSPFVQLRWFISHHYGKNTTLYMVNGAIMTIGFFVCRILVIPHFYWAIYVAAPHSLASGFPMHVRYAASFLFLPSVLNVFWFNLMIKGIMKMSKKGDEGIAINGSAEENRMKSA